MFEGIFIDAFDKDKNLAELMSTSGRYGLRVTRQKPLELMTQANNILASQPDLVALDYRLNPRQKRKYTGYHASSLAQQLRESILQSVTHDFPIILIASQEDIHAFFDNLTAHNLFDRYFIKSVLTNDCASNQQILSLVKGYKQLIKHWDKPEKWSKFLAVTRQEKVQVAYQAIRELDKLKAPHQVAHAISRYVIDRRGLLLDRDNVLARLGISKSGKDVEAIFELLHRDKIKYTGIFSEGWSRWWQHRLEDWGKNLCGNSLGKLETAPERVSCLNQKLGLKLSPAKSRWPNPEALIWYVCDSCHQPTEFNYCVSAYEPLPYRFLHPKQICWKCLETGEYKEHGLETDDGEEMIVEKIQNGEIRSGT
jgi:CheY-like chemotaxis protein